MFCRAQCMFCKQWWLQSFLSACSRRTGMCLPWLSKRYVSNLRNLSLTFLEFDTIDHDMLQERLNKKYGTGGTAFTWFTSYLSNRTQSVVINENESSTKTVKVWCTSRLQIGSNIVQLVYCSFEQHCMVSLMRNMLMMNNSFRHLSQKLVSPKRID